MTELLVVIVITALILLMLVPVRAGSRTKSQSLRCRDNFKQIMAAIMMYTAEPGSEDAERLALAIVLGTQSLVG